MRSIKYVVLIAVMLTAIFLAYFLLNKDATDLPLAESTSSTHSESDDLTVANDLDTPAKSAEDLSEQAENNAAVDTGNDAASPSATGTSAVSAGENSGNTSAQFPELYAYNIGHEAIDEAALAQLIKRLKDDPQLRGDLLNELRAEADSQRIKRLVFMLGQTATSDVLPVAEEMVYSGSKRTRQAGFNLLNQIAPRNPEAYDIAVTILGGESEPEVLISTLNVFAKPAGVTPETRTAAVAQIGSLATHEDSSVRSISLQIITRLTNEPDIAPILTNALYDQNSTVREAAAYSFADYPYQSDEVVQRLLEIAEDANEEKVTRRGAVYALSKMSPDEQTKARIVDAKKQINARVRNR